MRASKIGTKLLVILLIVAMILPMSAEVLATATEEWGFDEEQIVVTEDVGTVDEEVEAEETEIEEQEVVEPEAEIEAEGEAEEALTGKLTHEMQSAKIETAMEREGGDESSGTIKSDKYDTTPYAYQVANSGGTGRKTVFKLIQENDYSYEDAMYCVNAEKSFPSAQAYDYKNMGDIKTETTTAAASLINSIGAKNYKSLIWLIDNMYLPKQQPSEKLDYIKKAFASEINKNVIPPVTAEYIMENLTDDDIEVVQQYAIWYFTNGNTDVSTDYLKYYHSRYSNFGSMYVSSAMQTGGSWVSLSDRTGNGVRQEFSQILYAYLVDNAKKASTSSKFTYPTFAMQNADLRCAVDGDYYKVGPFKVNAGSASATIKLVDGRGYEIERSKYKIKIDGENDFSNKNVNEIFGKNYYVYLPIEGNDVSKVKMTIEYTTYETEATLWTPTTDDTLQPIVLITRGEKKRSDSREKDIDPKKFDLALRKYIIKAGNTNISNRIPDVNAGTIASTGTAEYKHRKAPVSVKAGSTVIYEIRVYNEGSLNGTATKITDYLPEGMTLAENSNINKIYGWTASSDGRVATTEYLSDSVIDAYAGSGELESLYVQIECKIADDLADNITENVVLTNVAEITGYSRTDNDSEPSVDPSTIDTKTFTGNKDNKDELDDPNYYYKGLQDDDDFEKVVISPNNDVFDLALRKFITKINGKSLSTSREPKVDVSKLKDGTSTNATYTHPKTTLEVSKGDIVTYTIRVYNEGDIDGYAEEISDFIPAGLGYLKDYTKNIENKWSIPSDARTTKLSQIENGTSNLKKEDFTGSTSLGDQVVVIGGGKFVSTALSSSSSSNLIKAFDKESGNSLSYKDVEVTCIVLADSIENNNLKNIAEIKKDSNSEGKGDRDSTPDTVDPNNYPNGEGNQDDHDYENLTLPAEKKFDLSLQKFITGVNDSKVSGREPTITKNSDGTFRYSHTTEALKVANKDLVTYTIRVYNEGDIDGYAKEVMDDIPAGLKYLPDNNVNKEFEWKMYDKSGKETTDVNQATSIKTQYLSKENEKNGRSNLIEAYNDSKQTPSYRDVRVVFEVVETALPNKTERTIINTAEITDDEDKYGNPVDDKDSTPGNNKSGEDDIDRERVSVKYFDLALKKSLTKIIITENGKSREINAKNEDDLLKVEINRKYINKTTVKFVYNITVTNQGEIAGYAKELKDHIPAGLKFVKEDNKDWTEVSKDVVKTEALANTLLEPGKSASVAITLEWENSENNLGQKVNIAEISKDQNDVNSPDIDSTPDNFKEGEDDQDDAPVILSISTGEEPVYIVLSTTVMAILVTGIVLIKKYVLI